MKPHLAHDRSAGLVELMRLERLAFAAKIRMTRALIGWSQTELAQRVGLTQRCVHQLERGDTEPRRATVRVIELLWLDQGIQFEDLADGGFRVSARPALFGAVGSDAGSADAAQDRRQGGASDH